MSACDYIHAFILPCDPSHHVFLMYERWSICFPNISVYILVEIVGRDIRYSVQFKRANCSPSSNEIRNSDPTISCL
jgi:hypothetical protein